MYIETFPVTVIDRKASIVFYGSLFGVLHPINVIMDYNSYNYPVLFLSNV